MLLSRYLFGLFLAFFPWFAALAQEQNPTVGVISGNLVDLQQKAVSGATVELVLLSDSSFRKAVVSDKEGGFQFTNLPYGYYRIGFSSVGFAPLKMDSIHLRAERYDFSLNDVLLKSASDKLQEVVVFAEKPLIQSKDGNLTFNAGESPLSAGSNAADLMKNVPLIATDADGKLTVKGKEPKILIDDKPVELNAQQLQDFLESMPGSMIERIEVMTNPPPQYANEPGGVINIVTRKGKVGRTGRVQVYAGTRGESGINGNFSYRKKGLVWNTNAGYGYAQYEGNGYSRRKNIYTDSVNYFNTDSRYRNTNRRPSFRTSVEYEWNPQNSFSLVMQYNENRQHNVSDIHFENLDRSAKLYKMSNREQANQSSNQNPSANFTYTHKSKEPGTLFRIFLNSWYSANTSDRYFFQEFLNPDFTPTGIDSTQQQFTDNKGWGYSVRTAWDKTFDNKKTFLSAGGFYNFSNSHVVLLSEYLKKPDGIYAENALLSNDFRFVQQISNLRFSFRQLIGKGMSITAGINAEQTRVQFELYKQAQDTANGYWTFMPSFNFNKDWEGILHLTASYRRTIRRPGMGELNPSIDYGDPYNLRFGNPELAPSTSHNFDLVLGRNKDKYYVNLGMGYNIVQDVFTQVRTLQPDGKTFVSWLNIDDRKEYGISSWNGYTFSRKFRVNLNASYTYITYSLGDRTRFRYRNGGSFTSGMNTSFTPTDKWNLSGGFTFNRFASPQGYVRWNTSMNLGIQKKFIQKKLVVTLNVIDPIQQQQNRAFTYGTNFIHESFSTTRTRNYRLTLSYNINQRPPKMTKEQEAEKEKLKKLMK